ncbi:PREDICTED: serine/threonine-protein phosphatase 7 long form homolog [Erythranthe guttata]|uniref:serine/threonine-protein phosphatase 7 long form homolog n=1 Tax=Erythranthe guttata TaxID=4155 RepID=UPI00064D771E|nr:PREDICTED: serine/threonine-protein phosphatase 7 long form homolog [Erythranthe guttata]|eukprot:XP_012849811.1 PREDICTED: serine/threonine-protein phosphatase 7 long form homolog [Erythranthe guttata]
MSEAHNGVLKGTRKLPISTIVDLTFNRIVRIWGLYGDDGDDDPHPRVMQYLIDTRFYGVYRCGSLVVNLHLIAASVERWRPETHTFHYRAGEATLTLEDVSLLWILPVDGLHVTGQDISWSKEQWQVYCQTWLGYGPSDAAFKGGRLFATDLDLHLRHCTITDDSTEQRIQQHTRCLLLLLLGEVMCPDTSSSAISLLYLRHFEDLEAVRTFSWGSAVLAYLYRELCTGALHRKVVEQGGTVELDKRLTNLGGVLTLSHVI